MNKLILVKYASEIFLKGMNRNMFENKLKNNITAKLRGLHFEIIIDQGRSFIKVDELDEAVNKIKNVFGVSEVCIVTKVDTDLQIIKEEALNKIDSTSYKTFKVITNRANKKFPSNSMDTSREVGAYILDNTSKELTVDVKNPECKVHIEIRGDAYVWTDKDKIKGVGGLPYGINGSTMLMLSGGIDSPVAGYLMARRGVALNCVYYHSHPYTSEKAKDKVKELAKILAGFTEEVNLYIVSFTEIQMSIIEKCREDELTIIMRRFMMRIACALAEKLEIDSVATGESIGQVASQTMGGLIISTECSDRPVFRPLIAMDKEDIIEIARKIGTFETSILPFEDCCTIFVPKHPKTNPKIEPIKKEESKLDVDVLIQVAIDTLEFVKLK